MEELAIIKRIHFGSRDVDRPVIWFEETHLDGGSLQIIEMKDIPNFLKKANCYDIKDLEGAAIIIEHDGAGSFCTVKDFFNR